MGQKMVTCKEMILTTNETTHVEIYFLYTYKILSKISNKKKNIFNLLEEYQPIILYIHTNCSELDIYKCTRHFGFDILNLFITLRCNERIYNIISIITNITRIAIFNLVLEMRNVNLCMISDLAEILIYLKKIGIIKKIYLKIKTSDPTPALMNISNNIKYNFGVWHTYDYTF